MPVAPQSHRGREKKGLRLSPCLCDCSEKSPGIVGRFPEHSRICHNRGWRPAVDRILNASTLESSPADSRVWIGRFVIAVVLGEAIWGFLVSITNNLALPAMARAMGGDTQSPLSLGKGDFNIPGLFASTLELCLAAIVALILNSWSQRSRRVRVVRTSAASAEARPARVAAAEPPLAQVVVPSAPTPAVPAKATTASQTSGTIAPSTHGPPTAAADPPKPKKQKAVYYNIVGEPVDPEE